MKTMNKLAAVFGMMGVLALGACGTTGSSSADSAYSGGIASGAIPAGNGVVRAIDLVGQGQSGIGGSGVGLGTVAGAVVGGVLGNQVGSGSGRTVATVAGAAGGAYAGNKLVDGQQGGSGVYQFTIRMNNGQMHTLRHTGTAGFQVGDRVRISNGRMDRY